MTVAANASEKVHRLPQALARAMDFVAMSRPNTAKDDPV